MSSANNLCKQFGPRSGLTDNYTRDRQQSKMFTLSMNVDKKSLETEFSIAICRPTSDKWQSKTLFLAIFDLRSLIVKSVFDCSPSSVCAERIFLKDFFQKVDFEKISRRQKSGKNHQGLHFWLKCSHGQKIHFT